MFSTRLLFLVVVVVVLTSRAKLSGAVNFTFGGTGNPFNCNPSGTIFCRGNASSTASGDLALIPVFPNSTYEDYLNTYGIALTGEPLLLLNSTTNKWDSFTTSFQFLIQRSEYGPGDGMTFVMLNVSNPSGLAGDNFGLYDVTNREVGSTLAIEFDTYKNIPNADISGNHVGLDLENIISKVSRNASEVGINLSGGEIVYAWIDFDSTSQKLEVRINLNNFRPVQAFLEHEVDLSDVFRNNPQVYVGFTASNGYCYCHSFYTVYEWKFESFPGPTKFNSTDPPSPSSTPKSQSGPSLSSAPESQAGHSSSSAPKSQSGNQKGIIAGTATGATVLFVLFGLSLLFLRRRRNRRKDHFAPRLGKLNDTEVLPGMADNLRYSYKQLSLATGQFSEDSKLGQGGFGSVYRGVIPSTGLLVAVKRVSHDSKQGLREFMAEFSIISQLRHRNIVRLLGWCRDKNKLLLVYEFMPNGSLDKALFHPVPGSVLSWKHRFQIIVGAAEALHYLHEGWRQQIIHRDFKSSNIMLDENFNAMLGDFGLARMVDRHENPATTMMAGTYGYIAPEAPASGKFTEKTDVYAFGAVALEIACGRMALNFLLPEKERLLVDWVWKRLDEDNLMSVVDSRLEGEYDSQQIQVLLLVGLLCSHPNPNDRPSMRQVVEILLGDVAIPPVPLSKPEYQSSGRQFRSESLLAVTDTMSRTDVKPADQSTPRSAGESEDQSTPRSAGESDHLIFSKSSTTSTAASEPMI